MSSAVPTYPVGSTPVPAARLRQHNPADTGRPATAHGRAEEIRVFGPLQPVLTGGRFGLIAFLMAGLMYVDGHVMAIVPQGSKLEQDQVLPGDNRPRDVVVSPAGQPVPPTNVASSETVPRGSGSRPTTITESCSPGPYCSWQWSRT